MKKLRGIFLLALTAMAAFALSGCGTTTVELNKYITISATGYESMGTVSYSFDQEAFNKDYANKIKVDEDDMKAFIEQALAEDVPMPAILVGSCVDANLDKYSGVSNGDKVTLTWDCSDESAEEYFNCKLEYSDITYTVEGLEEIGEFNPFDYLTVSYEGYSSIGTVKLEEDQNREEMISVNFQVDKEENLTNGDTITITASYRDSEEYFSQDFGAVLSPMENTYTVEGLPEIGTLNPFDYLTVYFEGVSSEGTAHYDTDRSRDEMKNIAYDFDKEEGLSNGDTVTVKATLRDDAEAYKAYYGLVVEPLEATYTVEGLGTYIDSASQIPQETIDTMVQQGQDVFMSYVANHWTEGYEILSVDYQGNYFLSLKEGMDTDNDRNYIHMVYKVDFIEIDNNRYSIYYDVRFRNLILNPDGSCQVDISDYQETESTCEYGTEKYKSNGYSTINNAYTTLVQSKLDNYTCEDNITAQ